MGGYKEHKIFSMMRRRGVITTYIICIAIIFIIAVMLMRSGMGQKEVQDIVYTENSNIDYKVYLKENEFFKEDYLGKDNQYIASLINYIEANLEYQLESADKNVDYKYTYKVIAEVDVLDEKTKNPLYEYEEILVNEKEYRANTNSKLVIDEQIKIDYNKYNDLIKEFVTIYDLADSDASLSISMYVDIADDEEISNTPAMTLKIPLTTKTMAIDIESKVVSDNSINVYKTFDSRGNIFIAVILIMIDLFIVRHLMRFMDDTKDEESAYNAKLRKIMISYGSYIQKINNEFEFDREQVLEVKIFEDLLQIRETINKPILMTEKENAMETYFFIPCDDTIYMYELKAGNFKKGRGKRFKEKGKKENIEEIFEE